MKITIKGNDIHIELDSGPILVMDWEGMRQVEKALQIIREIQKTTKIENIELTV